ncbi:hypothetical protein SEA_BUDSKI_98 [Gordonia phage Budski]|nr:hypothetical protein SEA_BUDSKI_98 [Gordonia phage Budski]
MSEHNLPPAPEGMQWVLEAKPQTHSCASCNTPLPQVFKNSPGQYHDALEVVLTGGYGMFFDNIDGDHTVFLCHRCAHAACEVMPWLKRVVGPLHGACDEVIADV